MGFQLESGKNSNHLSGKFNNPFRVPTYQKKSGKFFRTLGILISVLNWCFCKHYPNVKLSWNPVHCICNSCHYQYWIQGRARDTPPSTVKIVTKIMTIEHGSIDFMFVTPLPSCWIRYYSHTFFNVDLCLIHVIDMTLHDNITDLKAEKLKLTDGLAVNTGCLFRLSGMQFIALDGCDAV